jgi:GWxTD domain-containing protein
MSRIRFTITFALVTAFWGYPATQARAQAVQPQDASLTTSDNSTQTNPLKRKLSDKEIREQQKELRQELKGPYKKWLDQDVRWIITDQERKAFLSLSNDEERDAFIEQFWRRRNPDPESPDNSYREEIYRRIAYANEHFGAGEPGWMTDRGHMYIAWGPPNSVDSHPSGGAYNRPVDQGGGMMQTFPFEVWNYRHLDGVGDNIDIEFVDTCMCGDYHMTLNPNEKNALAHTPGSQNLAAPTGNPSNSPKKDGSYLTSGNNDEFSKLEQYSELEAAPMIKFKDLDEFITSHKVLTGPFFPFDVRTDFVKITDDTVLVPVTLQIRNRDITYKTTDGVAKGVVNILGRVSTITGRIAQTFEDTVEVDEPSELLSKTLNSKSVYWKALPLRPGHYRLDIVIKDVNNPDHIGTYARSFLVPEYDDDKLASSSLILADKMQEVPSKDIGTGQFVIGNTFIRPRVSATMSQPVSFNRDQSLDFWMQVYNLKINPKTKQNEATVHYLVTNLGTHKTLFEATDTASRLNPNSDQVTLAKSMPLSSLQPGKYELTISVNDGVSKQQLAQSAPFEVTQ